MNDQERKASVGVLDIYGVQYVWVKGVEIRCHDQGQEPDTNI